MCVVSMIMDHYNDKWRPLLPQPQPQPQPQTNPFDFTQQKLNEILSPPPRQIPQKDIDEFYALLNRAREYDKKNNEPDCELQEKKDTLQKLAEQLGVKISFDEVTS